MNACACDFGVIVDLRAVSSTRSYVLCLLSATYFSTNHIECDLLARINERVQSSNMNARAACETDMLHCTFLEHSAAVSRIDSALYGMSRFWSPVTVTPSYKTTASRRSRVTCLVGGRSLTFTRGHSEVMSA